MDPESKETTIFGLANRCEDLFKEYLDGPVPTQKCAVEELRSRFRLWAAYTGAFADTGSSLDDRLILDKDVGRMVLNLLAMVLRNIQSGEYATLCRTPPRFRTLYLHFTSTSGRPEPR